MKHTKPTTEPVFDFDLEATRRLMGFLMGELLDNAPTTLTPGEAFSVIHFLQEDRVFRELKLIPDHFEKCNWCDCLYDRHCKGGTVGEYTSWYEDMDIPESLVDENEGACFCSSECEYQFFQLSTLGRLLLGCGYTDKRPDKPGEYWFYGWLSGKTKEGKPELVLVEAFRGASSLVFASREGYVYKADAIGLWKPARLPEPPSAEAMKELSNKLKEKGE